MIDLTTILDDYKVPYATEGNHHCREGWVQIDCPYCGKDTQKWHLGYNLHDGHMNCWRCGWLPVLKTLAIVTGAPYKTLKELLGDLTPESKIQRFTGHYTAPAGVRPMLPTHKRYLQKRGFNHERISRLWQVQGIGHGYGGMSWRLFIPIYFRGTVVSWTTRSIVDGGTRYISADPESESISHHNVLYGYDYVRGTAIVVEGPTDVWKIGPGAVATLGTGFSPEQVTCISTFPIRYICFDAERPAQRRANRLCDELMCLPGETYNIVLNGKDPGSADNRTIKELRRLLL